MCGENDTKPAMLIDLCRPDSSIPVIIDIPVPVVAHIA